MGVSFLLFVFAVKFNDVVMPGLVPGMTPSFVSKGRKEDVDGRNKPGHDGIH